jgi:hypothetical protein
MDWIKNKSIELGIGDHFEYFPTCDYFLDNEEMLKRYNADGNDADLSVKFNVSTYTY